MDLPQKIKRMTLVRTALFILWETSTFVGVTIDVGPLIPSCMEYKKTILEIDRNLGLDLKATHD